MREVADEKVYENVVVGNFLYGLGFSMCANARSQVVPSSVNLLQQTPDDRLLADVLLEFPGVVRLIEFKRKSNKDKKEKKKSENLTLTMRKLKHSTNEKMKEISRKVHWFVETDPEEQSFVSRVVPYIDAYSAEALHQVLSLEQLVESISQIATSGGEAVSADDYKTYLDLVACCNGPEDASGKVEPATSGLLITANGGGGIRFVELTSLLQLRLQHRSYVQEIVRAAELVFDRGKSQTREQSRSQEQARSRGLEL